MADTTKYLGLITSQYKDRLKFVRAVAELVTPLASLQVSAAAPAPDVDGTVDALVDLPGALGSLAATPALLDIDISVGAQLDLLGDRIGLSREVDIPVTGVVSLGDEDYRTLLLAKIQVNRWDGSMESLQSILSSLFPGTSLVLKAVDNQDMTMDIYIYGGSPSPLQLALLQGGKLVPKPAGVRINGFVMPAGPLFGLDFDDSTFSGLDVGSFATYL